MNQHTLGDLAGKSGLIVDGDWVESKDQDQNGDVRLIQLADIGVGEYLDKSSRRLNSAVAHRLHCTYLKPGDVLVARMPDPIGRACIFPGNTSPCVTVVDVCIVRPDEEIADARYVCHMMNSPSLQRSIESYVKGSTRQRISRGNLESLPISLPPLDEQRRIAAILDQADALRRKARSALINLESLRISIYRDMFGDPVRNEVGWPRHPLAVICSKITDGTHRSPPIAEAGIPYVTAKHLRPSGLDFFSAPWFINQKDHDEIYSRCDPKPGDVLYIKDGATTGIAAVNRYDFPFSMLSSLALLRPDQEKCEAEYLVSTLNYPTMKENILRDMAGAAIRRLTLTKINAIRIPLPGKSLQKAYSKKILIIGRLGASYDRQIELSNQLFYALQRRGFDGDPWDALGVHRIAAE